MLVINPLYTVPTSGTDLYQNNSADQSYPFVYQLNDETEVAVSFSSVFAAERINPLVRR